MNHVKWQNFAIVPLLFASTYTVSFAGERVREISWADLVPLGGDVLASSGPDEPTINHDGSAQTQQHNWSSVVSALNGKTVALLGFIVPLAVNHSTVSDFLLVPNYGACIHVPPPPANQTVFVSTREPYALNGSFETVRVTGVLRTEGFSTDLAEAGYTLDALQVEPYRAPSQREVIEEISRYVLWLGVSVLLLAFVLRRHQMSRNNQPEG